MDDETASDLDALVRRVDPDRWLSSRFIGALDARADVIAVYAFDHELARAPKVASNALLGEMRLTWWREALAEIFEGRPVRHHPAAQALAQAVQRRGLDRGSLETMIDAALEAGRAVHAIYRAGFEVTHKADQSPVTDADRAAEAIILASLAQAAPEIPVVAEEEVAAGRVPAVGHEFFLVDPLDGTKEFIQRRGDFTVNIALIRAGSPVLGVVYAPANSKLFAGNVAAHAAIRCAADPISKARRKANSYPSRQGSTMC